MWSLFDALSHDMGIDLGTANTLVHVKERGLFSGNPPLSLLKVKMGRCWP